MNPRFFYIIVLTIVLLSCRRTYRQGFSLDKAGYYYQLLSFDETSSGDMDRRIAWLSACFRTQSDSVFWDSHNNLNDRFFIRRDSAKTGNFFMDYLYGCTAQDSVCLLIRPKDFFAQQFRVDSIPFFCRNDTIVKVNFKVKELLNENDFHKKKIDLKNNELRQIKSYFTTTAEMEAAKDAAGFYWVEKTNEKGPIAQPGDLVTIQYRGEFLNGRFLEQSPGKFEFVYGTPDQLLKGINYVIGELKVGENAKIILPSHLAYGETGSSNGTVPPFTPLVYQIKILEIEKQHQP